MATRPALAAVQLNSPSPTKEATKDAAARHESAGEANLAVTAFAAADATTEAAAVEAAAAVEEVVLPVAADEELVDVSRLGLPCVPGYDLIQKLGCGGFGSVVCLALQLTLTNPRTAADPHPNPCPRIVCCRWQSCTRAKSASNRPSTPPMARSQRISQRIHPRRIRR